MWLLYRKIFKFIQDDENLVRVKIPVKIKHGFENFSERKGELGSWKYLFLEWGVGGTIVDTTSKRACMHSKIKQT